MYVCNEFIPVQYVRCELPILQALSAIRQPSLLLQQFLNSGLAHCCCCPDGANIRNKYPTILGHSRHFCYMNTTNLTSHNKSLQRWVFPLNQLHSYWQPDLFTTEENAQEPRLFVSETQNTALQLHVHCTTPHRTFKATNCGSSSVNHIYTYNICT